MRNLIFLPLYYLVFVPISLVIRRIRDPLRRGRQPSARHYWHYLSPSQGGTGDGARAFDAARRQLAG
jgi:hypothetical protein